MRRWFKIALRLLAAFAILFVLIWLSLALYIETHKKEILNDISAQLSPAIKGKLSIRDIEPRLLTGFPLLSVTLKNVSIIGNQADSSYASKIFISMNVFSFLRGNFEIREVSLKDGRLFLLADSSGISNFMVAHQKNGVKSNSRVREVNLDNVELIYQNPTRQRDFRFDIRRVEFDLKFGDAGWRAMVKTDILIKNFCINTNTGSFLPGKVVKGSIALNYNTASSELSIPWQTIRINGDPWNVSASFLTGEPKNYTIDLKSGAIQYENLLALLPARYVATLNHADFTRPIQMDAHLRGKMAFKDTPFVAINCKINDNELKMKDITITKCSFECSYTNHSHASPYRNVNNIVIRRMQGSWDAIPFRADSITMDGFSDPIINGTFFSDFPLEKLNPLTQEKFDFKAGKAEIKIGYKAESTRSTRRRR